LSIDVAREIESQYPVFSYTATKLTPREVARTFVPPKAFQTLRDARNAILVGPRGSGKTTLLKMLTSEGLAAWEGTDAEIARERVQDVGVFIGVDAMWSEQISNGVEGDTGTFGAAAYALHIARAFTQTLIFRAGRDAQTEGLSGLHLPISISKSDEINIAGRASKLFKLPEAASSLLSLDHNLGDRLNELGTYRYRLLDGQQLPDWVYLNPIQAISELAGMVNSACDEPTRKWALLFDELELAPDNIVSDILRRLRGNEPTLIFKLSLAPILRSTDLLSGEHGATHGQDIEYIPLTTADRSDSFVAEIFEKQRRSASLPAALTTRTALGESIFDAGERGGRPQARVDPYKKGAKAWHDMHWLRENDMSFAEYLSESGIDLDALDLLAPGRRASHIRKIRNLVTVRTHFRQGSRLDTQATRQLYTGEATMLAIPDGNPRMSTILVREIMTALTDPRSIPLDKKVQADAIEATTTRFLALLHAQAGIKLGDRAVTMVHLIDAIGRALHSRVVDAPFSADVPAGFFVDDGFPEIYLSLLTQAVNTGAIIHIPRDKSSIPVARSARGRHYRLSYLLAPRYGLPVRQGKSVALWTLLEGSLVGPPKGNPDKRRKNARANQPTLIDLEGIDD
jgi:hypothetical protein